MNAEIDAQYDKEYALIQLVEDSTERQNAMEALNAKYNENRRDAALEYAALLSDVVPKVCAGRYSAGGFGRGHPDAEAAGVQRGGRSRKARPAGGPERHRRGHGRRRDDRALPPCSRRSSPLDSGLSESEIQAAIPGDRLHHGAGADRRHPDVFKQPRGGTAGAFGDVWRRAARKRC